MPATSSRHSENAFALVSTLIILIIVTILAVGFMTTASLERSSAHAYTNIYDAQLAAGMGLEAAKKALSVDGSGNYTTMNDSFIVTEAGPLTSGTPTVDSNGNIIRYYFIGSGSLASAGSMNYYPLFSGTSTPSAPWFQSVSGSSQPSYPPIGSGTVDKTLFSSLQPQVDLAWVTTGSATANSPALRYTYWIEDMGGYIDADVAGNMSGTNQTHTRDLSIMQPLINSGSAMPASMIALWSLLDGTAPLDVQGTPEDQSNTSVVTDRQAMLTPGTVLQTIVGGGTGTTTTVQQNVVAGLRPDTEQAIIPYGFNYPNQGQPKTDLNAILAGISSGSTTAASGVTQIASAISTNLPAFASGRKGGLPATQDYDSTIAANILSYASTSGAPIVSSSYRAVGSYPMVNEVADSITWVTTYLKNHYPPAPLTGTNAFAYYEIQVSTYVELWNMTNQTLTGTARFMQVVENPLTIGTNPYLNSGTISSTNLANGSTVTLSPADPSNPVLFAPQAVTIYPNQFLLMPTFTTTYILNSGQTTPVTPLSLGASLGSSYQFYWNGQLVDQCWESRKSNTNFLSGSANAIWQDRCPGLRYVQTLDEPSNAIYNENPGDPRACYYIYSAVPETAAEQVNYANGSSFGTRNWRSNEVASPEPIYAEVRPSIWADSGHDSATPTVPGAGWSVTQTPVYQASIAPSYLSGTSMAPVVLSMSGSFKSITELGNIYDPAQWDVGVTATLNMPASLAQSGWLDIPLSGTGNPHYGGGFNLRIGKQEFSKFNQPGLRACQLMDILSAGSTRQTQGLVNINTATYGTLRALGAGLVFNRDAAIQPSSLAGNLYPPSISQQADEFANAVIAARTTAPFLSAAQLSQLPATSGTGFFGNMAEWSGAQTAPTVWSDAGSKEYFSRIYDLTSVRSRNFRVYVLGQAVDQNGKVLSTAKKVYQLFLHPQRDGSGNITSQYVQVTYEKDL